ncbi:hypothetical protein C8Q80DRAFT_163596 [Daedaleopsis nitida]|nr:hypothetical protein C8Q80DRAFT_163596 [Daedaleopsis nitida]
MCGWVGQTRGGSHVGRRRAKSDGRAVSGEGDGGNGGGRGTHISPGDRAGGQDGRSIQQHAVRSLPGRGSAGPSRALSPPDDIPVDVLTRRGQQEGMLSSTHVHDPSPSAAADGQGHPNPSESQRFLSDRSQAAAHCKHLARGRRHGSTNHVETSGSSLLAIPSSMTSTPDTASCRQLILLDAPARIRSRRISPLPARTRARRTHARNGNRLA